MAEEIERRIGINTKNQKYRKNQRNSGKGYVTLKGFEILERKCKPLPVCRKKCNSRISWDEQNRIFSHYWSLGAYDLRAAYIAPSLTYTIKSR